MSKILLFMATLSAIYAETVVVPDRYEIIDDENSSYIFSDEYRGVLPDIKEYQDRVIAQYSSEFGFNFDDKLRVGLASQNNQIANAFSTQIPFNSQLFYGAGAGEVDYFCSTSWLKGIILHETAHNFQLNPKESLSSRISHKIVGNTPFTFLGPLPIFPIPNIMINSFVLEGNAVLNESRFGIGGRLYSGYALAEIVSMAKADKIKPERMYNQTLDFPYSENHYLVGGFFQQFLARKYGVKRVNSYFKIHSKQFFPFFTSSAFKNTFGKTFKTLLKEFVDDVKTKHANFKATKGKTIATSQLFVPMNRTDREIYTLVGDYKSYPKILQFDKQSKQVSFKRGAYRTGEPFKIDNRYYTLSSVKTSPTKIKMGLIDDSAYLQKGSSGKVIQGYLSNNQTVYFDIPKSLDTPHIYIDGKFYDTSSSSVYINGDDLYYFKQNGHTRTLYKNKKPIFDYSGYYGFITDIGDDGSIYFISLTPHGSTAYSYSNGQIKRVALGDDVIEFKLINPNEALVATIGADEYKYQIIKINPTVASVPTPDYFLEDSSSLVTQSKDFSNNQNSKLKAKEYNPITNLEYSSLEQYMGYSDDEGGFLSLQANFVDPLMQNSLAVLLSADEESVVGGVGYSNNAHALEFGAEGYLVSHNDDYYHADERDNGYSAYLKLPLVATGYWRAFTTLDYTKDFDNIYRKPLSLSLDINNIKQFGVSKYPNSLNSLNLFISQDRGENSYGGSYSWGYGLPYQSFISFDATYMKSNTIDEYREKGIEINHNFGDIQTEKASISMPTIETTHYAKELKVGGIGVYKTIDAPLYFFSFPLSIQRESIYLKQKLYDIDFANENRKYSETTLGLESDFVFFNNFVAPIKFELLYNPDVKDQTQFRILMGMEF
ncbi:MAG: hypothetical protein GXO60_07440 [Epsilonproteobacteria bacterium]|nr:hypothetical protein [Campylobacterota bacterium]